MAALPERTPSFADPAEEADGKIGIHKALAGKETCRILASLQRRRALV